MEEPNKKSRKMLYIGIAAVVVVLVGYLIVKNVFSGNAGLYGQQVSASQLSLLNQIANNQTLANRLDVNAIVAILPDSYINTSYAKKENFSLLTNNGKPELLYVGTEWCPYCAATRWAFIIAVMRFGNLTGLQYSASSPKDSFPNTPTLSFYGYNYTSKYVQLSAVEYENRSRDPLENLTTEQANLFNGFSVYRGPYGGIPFLDLGNVYFESGSIIPPEFLAGKSWRQIISSFSQENSSIAYYGISTANLYTAQICVVINNTAPVCSQPYVKEIQKKVLAST